MNAETQRILRFDNPWIDGASADAWWARWLPDRYVPRALNLTLDDSVCLVVGPRQVGKSTLIWKTLSGLATPPLYVNCEEPALQSWLTSPAQVLADLTEQLPDVQVVFFEEVQALPDAGRFLKGLVDRRSGLHFVATGSSAFHLEAATRESLAGRAARHLLLPLSVSERLAAMDGPPLRRTAEAPRVLEDALVFGGYPGVLAEADREAALGRLVEAFVIRDASDRFRIRHLGAFRQLLRLMASQIGNLCNFSEWAALAGVSQSTIAQYASLLEDTHLVRLVPPFVGGKRAELTGRPKVYFLDNGVRNALFGGFSPYPDRADRGALLENHVFGELCRATNPLTDEIRFWRSKSKAEVDFVVLHRGQRLAVEVKAGDARGRLTRSAHSFLKAYSPDVFYVVHEGQPQTQVVHGVTVEFLSPLEIAARVAERCGRG